MTYKSTKTLAEVTQELDAIRELLDVVAERQADITRRLEYVEDAVEAKKDKK